MILINDFQKFYSIITELTDSEIQCKLYGNMEEVFRGAFGGLETPPNNTLCIKVVALTTIGTIYCNVSAKLNDNNTVSFLKHLYSNLHISEARVSYDKTSGNITIS